MPAPFRRHDGLVPFAVLACALSWGYWVAAAAAGWSYYPGLFGPAVAALAVACARGDGDARALLRSCVTLTRGRAVTAAVVGAPLAAVAAAAALGAAPDWSKDGLPGGAGFAAFALAMLAAGFGEEVGWRGLALPALLARHDARGATLRVWALWALWHWPLFVLLDNYADLGLVGVLPWALSLLCGAVVFTWLYDRTGGSVLAAGLFHAAIDVATASDGTPAAVAIAVNAGVVAGAIALMRSASTRPCARWSRRTLG